MSKKLKVLFFVPHPDDLEFGAALSCFEALRLGHDVTEILMTNGQYGTNRIEFRGKRLEKIRSHEIENAVQVYDENSNNKLRLIRLDYIDGQLPLDLPTISTIREIIIKQAPDLLFAPDPWHAIDSHPDHLNTGRLVYHALLLLKPHKLPKNVLYFYSIHTNLAIKVSMKGLKVMSKALFKHRSQVNPDSINLMVGFERFKLRWQKLITGFSAVRVRRQTMKNGAIVKFNGFKRLKDKIKYLIYYRILGIGLPDMDKYFPTAKELGLKFNLKQI